MPPMLRTVTIFVFVVVSFLSPNSIVALTTLVSAPLLAWLPELRWSPVDLRPPHRPRHHLVGSR